MVVAVLSPVLLCVSITWFHARTQERLNAEAAARLVRLQTERILNQATDILTRVVALSSKPCDEALPHLQLWAMLDPYVRSLLLVKQDRIYCSSAPGAAQDQRDKLSRWPIEVPPARWYFTVPGTPPVPESPAILLGMPGNDGGAGVVSIDGRYVQNLLNSVASLGDYRLELALGNGSPIRSDSWHSADEQGGPILDDVSQISDRATLQIRVGVPADWLVDRWQRLMWVYLPAAMLCGTLLGATALKLEVNRHSFKEQLRRAMRAGEFHVEYQPVCSIATGRCGGVEALMRWNRPGVGLVRPDIFIAAAEADGMIILLTQHLFKLIARDTQNWDTPPSFHIAVNIATDHLCNPVLVPDILAFRSAVRQSHLVLEITERSLISESGQARKNIDALRAQGVFIAIDDFGTGHSSLSYLQQFPVDYLKIDKGFVQAILPSGQDAPVLDMIISLSHHLGLAVVAEGVETTAQLDYLTRRGVAFIQGYLFAHPMGSPKFIAWYVDNAGEDPAR
ncbi:EAL domain-containing protein [Achromobacter sp. UMC46]|uniref:EAL domain-containing protein n=1 Tax=Achromobacter sp. UMC46 TaxID=1862319 RepID=UPI00351C2630